MKKPSGIDIVVALAGDVLVRLDVATDALRVLPARPDAPAALSAALAAAPVRRGAAVLFLSSDIFSQTIRLPRAQTSGLSQEELSAALFYEIEPFSNLPRAQAPAAFVELAAGESSAQRTWHAAQLPQATLAALDAAARAAHARFAGCAPCDALPAPAPERAARLRQAALAAAATPPRIPVVLPRRDASERTVRLAALLLLPVAAGCLVHALSTARSLSSLRREADARKPFPPPTPASPPPCTMPRTALPISPKPARNAPGPIAGSTPCGTPGATCSRAFPPPAATP